MIDAAAPGREPGAVLRAWAEAEFEPWRHTRLTRADIERGLREEIPRSDYVVRYRIGGGAVEIDDFSRAHHPRLLDTSQLSGYRAALYLDHLRTVVRLFGLAGEALIGVSVADRYIDRLRVPVFSFQKPIGGRGLLLPDVDLLGNDYAIDRDVGWVDRVPAAAKHPGAIFVGSTTGDRELTRDIIDRNLNGRIRAARFFRGEARVQFDLPNIVQCDADTADYIRSLDIGGTPRDWSEQHRFRYLISIDGNGATCSRVAIALHSRSVLLKYASSNMLYYFRGLVPWRHYVPIVADGDVLDIVDAAETSIDLDRDIALAGRTFAQRYLSRAAILRYTAWMLAGYMARFGTGGDPVDPFDGPAIDAVACFRGAGDRWADPGAWVSFDGCAIEGAVLTPTGGILADGIEVEAVDTAGRRHGPVPGRLLCGSRGDGIALAGLSVRLTGAARGRYAVAVHQRFEDGSVRVSADGDPPEAGGAAMIGLRIEVTPSSA